MSIEILQRELDQTGNTLNVVILSLSEAQAMLDEIAKLREELANANGLYSECLRGNQALRQQAEESNREREEERCAASVLKLKLEGQIDDAVGVIIQAKERYRAALDAKRKAEENELSAAAELDEANAQLNAHRRFHSKVGCPGGQDCYVCALELEQEILEHGDALSGDDYQAMQDIRARQSALNPETQKEEENPLCVCNHRLNTHNPCCVSACGCDGFVSADKPLTDEYVDRLMSAQPQTHWKPGTGGKRQKRRGGCVRRERGNE
jgi:hypothetical protein